MAITKFKAPDGGEYEGQVVWLDVGGKRTRFVLPYHPYPALFDRVVHYGSGRNNCLSARSIIEAPDARSRK